MSTFDPQLLLPPTEDDDVLLQRRVWPGVAVLAGGLSLMTMSLQLIGPAVGRNIPSTFFQSIALLVALLPLALWIMTDGLPEQRSAQPRPHLLWVMLLVGVLTNAVVHPFYQWLQPWLWLPVTDSLTQFVGTMLAYALVPAVLQVMMLRLLVWPQHYIQREDAIAYAVACAVGVSTVLNAHDALSANISLAANARQMFTTFALQLMIALIVGYGLAETSLTRTPVLLLPAAVVAASVLAAITVAFGERLAGAALRVGPVVTQPLRGLVVYIAALLIVGMSVQFLQRSADRAMREALPTDR